MIVVDASATAELLLGRPAADAVARHLQEHGPDLHAPHLHDAEVASVLRRHLLRGELTEQRAEGALSRMDSFPMRRYPHAPLIRRALQFRENLTIYDGLYLALAELLDAPLLTLDGGLGRMAGDRALLIPPRS